MGLGTLGCARPAPRHRAAAGVLAVLLAVGGTVARLGSFRGELRRGLPRRGLPRCRRWEPWSQERLDTLRGRGTPVFVDFTARWCLTCQVNERVALDNTAVRQGLAEAGIATLRADWTDRNDAIRRRPGPVREGQRSAVRVLSRRRERTR